jgi:peptidoglycan-associated lipoprotein
MRNQMKLGFVVLLAAIVAGCASKDKPAETTAPVETRSATTTTTPGGATTKPEIPRPEVKLDPLTDPKNILSQRIVYFDYDQDTVKSEFQALVQAHAKYLSDNRNRKIRLEGHADERGSREYNMALGQRRADALRKAMNLLGVSSDRIETISFGEDKPKAQGHDEAAWAQNRRVEIRYDNE